ncbi:MAG: zinc ribbon domain-containing protein [Gammaproteobacteria bacterium]|nr:zinc ribbon domain-containing protein [Gammaproteobacteria bacterium]
MPIYEYACESCGHELEVMQKMSDAALADCPACGKPALKKLISAAGFVLKGGGWYATDFRDKGKKKGAVGDAAESKEAAPAPACGSGGCDACSD